MDEQTKDYLGRLTLIVADLVFRFETTSEVKMEAVEKLLDEITGSSLE